MQTTDKEAMQHAINGFLTRNDDLPILIQQAVRNAALQAIEAFQEDFDAFLFFDGLEKVVRRLKTDYGELRGIV